MPLNLKQILEIILKIKTVCCALLLLSCEDSSVTRLKEPWDVQNDPRYLKNIAWNMRLVDLPEAGSSTTPVWVGSWYPMSQGGTSEAMYKYDKATGTTGAGAWEKAEADSLRDVPWAGHCNGTASAGMMVKEPIKDVYYNGVYFSVDDIKALLAEIWAGNTVGVGGRCNNRDVLDTNGRHVRDECRDLNAATFHLALANKVLPVIADVDASEAVWNYVITEFKIIHKLKGSKQDVIQWLTGSSASEYVFNQKAVDWMYYTVEVNFAGIGLRYYQYILEIDKAGNIIGGEWYGDSKTDHPDFLFRPTVETTINPYLNIGIVKSIHARSIL